MRILFTVSVILVAAKVLVAQPAKKEFIVYFETPLVCTEKETIGCGSRAKPLLLALEATEFASEAWLNREGTIVAIALEEPYLPLRQLLHKAKAIFDKHEITFKPINGAKIHGELTASFRQHGKWYRGAAVDSLSWEEAAWLTEGALSYLEGFDKLRADSAIMLRREVTHAIATALIANEESLEATHEKIIRIASRYVSADALQKSIERFQSAHEGVEMYTSTFTCPNCGHRKAETLPADRCIMEYTCQKCQASIKHKEGDCCVFCSYGDVKCPTAE